MIVHDLTGNAIYIREQDEPVNGCAHNSLVHIDDRMTTLRCEDCGKQFTNNEFKDYLNRD